LCEFINLRSPVLAGAVGGGFTPSTPDASRSTVEGWIAAKSIEIDQNVHTRASIKLAPQADPTEMAAACSISMMPAINDASARASGCSSPQI
jgi:hypothetical protein